MIDRRKFLGLMFGAAVVPKDVLAGLTTPAPVKDAFTKVYKFTMPDGSVFVGYAQYTLAGGPPSGKVNLLEGRG
jgi:hypothetical protein